MTDEEFEKLKDEMLIQLNKELDRQLMVLGKKIKVIDRAKIINNCCLLIFVADLLLPRNNINIWFTPIAFLIMIGTFIYTHLFIKYYGRKKQHSGDPFTGPDTEESNTKEVGENNEDQAEGPQGS